MTVPSLTGGLIGPSVGTQDYRAGLSLKWSSHGFEKAQKGIIGSSMKMKISTSTSLPFPPNLRKRSLWPYNPFGDIAKMITMLNLCSWFCIGLLKLKNLSKLPRRVARSGGFTITAFLFLRLQPGILPCFKFMEENCSSILKNLMLCFLVRQISWIELDWNCISGETESRILDSKYLELKIIRGNTRMLLRIITPNAWRIRGTVPSSKT